jgi:hypothetical protein
VGYSEDDLTFLYFCQGQLSFMDPFKVTKLCGLLLTPLVFVKCSDGGTYWVMNKVMELCGLLTR